MAKAGSIRGLQVQRGALLCHGHLYGTSTAPLKRASACFQVFISDIRACQNREQETKRVDKELAKIRKKFGSEKSNLGGVLLAVH